MNQKGISSIIIILIIVGVLVVAGGIWYWQSQKEQPAVCTQDAKLCPDGSYVSRTSPNCEFAACPEVKDETANWKTYRNDEYGFEMKYPRNLILQESEGKTSTFFYWAERQWLPSIFVGVGQGITYRGEIIFSENIIINNIDFKKDYQVVYMGGMEGSRDTDYLIYAYTEINDNHYLLSLHLHEWKIITSEEAFNKMRDEKNEYVKIYNQILSTFKFTK